MVSSVTKEDRRMLVLARLALPGCRAEAARSMSCMGDSRIQLGEGGA